MTPKWGFGVAMLPVGALRFYQAHFGRTMLPKWPLWAHLFYPVLYSVSELRRVCFRQARVARAACFVQGPLPFLPPNPTCGRPHIWGFPRFPHLPFPSHASSSETPPLPLFLIKTDPPATSSDASSFSPAPEQKRNKKYPKRPPSPGLSYESGGIRSGPRRVSAGDRGCVGALRGDGGGIGRDLGHF